MHCAGQTLSSGVVFLLLQEEWPEVYWKALQKMGRKQAVDVPAPHPKFTVQVRGNMSQKLWWSRLWQWLLLWR
jgi:hypothetical protein